jgi:hypothetical protein
MVVLLGEMVKGRLQHHCKAPRADRLLNVVLEKMAFSSCLPEVIRYVFDLVKKMVLPIRVFT